MGSSTNIKIKYFIFIKEKSANEFKHIVLNSTNIWPHTIKCIYLLFTDIIRIAISIPLYCDIFRQKYERPEVSSLRFLT